MQTQNVSAALQAATSALTGSQFGATQLGQRVQVDRDIADLLDELATQLIARDSHTHRTTAQGMTAAARAVRERADALNTQVSTNPPCRCSHQAAAHTEHGCWKDLPDGGNVCPCEHASGFTTVNDRVYARREAGA